MLSLPAIIGEVLNNLEKYLPQSGSRVRRCLCEDSRDLRRHPVTWEDDVTGQR